MPEDCFSLFLEKIPRLQIAENSRIQEQDTLQEQDTFYKSPAKRPEKRKTAGISTASFPLKFPLTTGKTS